MKKHLFILMLIPLLFFSSCEKNSPALKEVSGETETQTEEFYPKDFLFLNNESVSFEEFRYYYLNYKNMYLEKDAAFFDQEENEEKLKNDIVTILLDNRGIRLLAEENGFVLTNADRKAVAENIKNAKKEHGEKAFSESLSSVFMTEDLYRRSLENALVSSKLFSTLFEEGGKFAWDKKTYYAYFKENFLSAETVLFPYEKKETKEKCENTLKKAEEFLEKLKSGEEFYYLVNTYGNDLVFYEGDSFQKGKEKDTFYQAVAPLKAGEISPPVLTEDGVFLLRRIEDSPSLMEKKRANALFGSTDEKGVFHPGAYDEEFILLYKKRSENIKITYGKEWNGIRSNTVF